MEIKYEPVFGPQELFDDAPEDCFCVAKNVYDDCVFYREVDRCLFWFDCGRWKPLRFMSCTPIAMRSIIRTPTWTVADQKAGKLPPVGSKYLAGSDKREFTCLFHGKGNGTTSIVGHTDDGEVTGYQLQYCYPIESPEEKAARLREEWAENANEVIFKQCSSTTLNEYLRVIHDAILSGELAAPKGGE